MDEKTAVLGMSLSKALGCGLILLIIIILIVPNASGQTTRIVHVSYPSSANNGDLIHVNATISFSGGYSVDAGVIDLLSPTTLVAGSVNATPLPCAVSNNTICTVDTHGVNGTELFRWAFYVSVSATGVKVFEVQTFVTDSSFTPVTYQGSQSYYHFDVLVNVTTPMTSTTYPQQVLSQTTQSASTATPNWSNGMVVVGSIVLLSQ